MESDLGAQGIESNTTSEDINLVSQRDVQHPRTESVRCVAVTSEIATKERDTDQQTSFERQKPSTQEQNHTDLQFEDVHKLPADLIVNTNRTTYRRHDLTSEQIRLLQILPGELSSELQCQFKIVSLSDKPHYIALSYTWGSNPACYTITVNEREVTVGENLWRFLCQARSMGFLDALWIDAICIDQNNGRERTHQVALMSKIYGQAAQVRVWLGPSNEEGKLAIDTLRRIRPYFRNKQTFSQLWCTPAGPALAWLCEREYWTRLWIFQEIMLAKEVMLMCGESLVIWQSLEDLLLQTKSRYSNKNSTDRYKSVSAVLSSPANSLAVKMRLKFYKSSLLDLMEATMQLECTEIRDKAYALLALVEVRENTISPDYDIPVTSLAHSILRDEYKVKTPRSIYEVDLKCRQLEQAFKLKPSTLLKLEGSQGDIVLPPDTLLEQYPLGIDRGGITLWWAVIHGHESVEHMLMEGTSSTRSNYFSEKDIGRAAVANDDALQILLKARSLTPKFWYEDVVRYVVKTNHPRTTQVIHSLIEAKKIGSRYSRNVNEEAAMTAVIKMSDVDMLEFLSSTKQFHCTLHWEHPELTLFYEAVYEQNPRILDLLLTLYHTDINYEGGEGDILFDKSMKPNRDESRALEPTQQARLEVIRLLISRGADINAKDAFGRTLLTRFVLYHAADQNESPFMKELLVEEQQRLYECVDSRLIEGRLEPLQQHFLDNMQLFISCGADVNAEDELHRTALWWAAYTANLGVINLLLPYRPNPDLEDRWGVTALQCAVSMRKKLFERFLHADPLMTLQMQRYDLVIQRLEDYNRQSKSLQAK